MYKKALLVMTIAFGCNLVLSVLPSCRFKHRGTGYEVCTVPTCFTYKSITVQPYDSKKHVPLDSTAYTAIATDLAFNVFIDGTNSVCYKQIPGNDLPNLSLFSTAKAYAAYPVCPVRQGGDSIVAYNIYSDRDYDLTHPAGSSLNDIITTDDIPTRTLYGTRLFADFMVDKAPAVSGNYYKFTIILTQKDGETITVATQPIKLL